MQPLGILPLDGRPVCYDWLLQLASMANVSVLLPPRNQLGCLKEKATTSELQTLFQQGRDQDLKNFTSGACHLSLPQHWIVSIDMLLYGGLIPSRLGNESIDSLIQTLHRVFQSSNNNDSSVSSVHGFSSIMRIPNYNLSQEEPDYWDEWGEALYQFSVTADQESLDTARVKTTIPEPILTDFLERRQRNFKVNLALLDSVAQGRLQTLTYCQDDTGPYGLNVQEARMLTQAIAARGLSDTVNVKTGADEVASCLMAKHWTTQTQLSPRIGVCYSHPKGGQALARFDGLSIQTVVSQQITACGGVLVELEDDNWTDRVDLILIVHTPASHNGQGDHCSNINAHIELEQYARISKLLSQATLTLQPCILADVAYANGADPALIPQLFRLNAQHNGNLIDQLLYGFAGWNTPGNSIGCAVSMAIIRWLFEKTILNQKEVNQEEINQERDKALFLQHQQACRELLLTRLCDDWLYQSKIRQRIREKLQQAESPELLDTAFLNESMQAGLAMILHQVNLPVDTAVRFEYPCNRTFEIRVIFENNNTIKIES